MVIYVSSILFIFRLLNGIPQNLMFHSLVHLYSIALDLIINKCEQNRPMQMF